MINRAIFSIVWWHSETWAILLILFGKSSTIVSVFLHLHSCCFSHWARSDVPMYPMSENEHGDGERCHQGSGWFYFSVKTSRGLLKSFNFTWFLMFFIHFSKAFHSVSTIFQCCYSCYNFIDAFNDIKVKLKLFEDLKSSLVDFKELSNDHS